MAASRACGRSRAAAMLGSSGQAATPFPARRSPETNKADWSGVQKVNCRKAAREAPLGGRRRSRIKPTGAAASRRPQASPAGRLPARGDAPKGFIDSLSMARGPCFFLLCF